MTTPPEVIDRYPVVVSVTVNVRVPVPRAETKAEELRAIP